MNLTTPCADSIDRFAACLANSWKPQAKQTIAEWAKENIIIGGAEPGPLDFSRTPYALEILKEIQNPDNDRIVWSAGAQVSKTTVMLASCLFFILTESAESAFCMSTISLAEGLSKERLAKWIRDSPRLLEAFGDPRARTAGNTVGYKESMNGGFLVLIGSNSSAEMRSRPLRCLWLDEVSSYQPNKEGDVVNLLRQRQVTFFNSITMLASTPLLAGDRIDGELSKTDLRRFFVPCPHCGAYQYLRWAQFRWTSGDCRYYCEACDRPWSEWERRSSVLEGEWRATREPDPGFEKIPGFHLPGLYSPWESAESLKTEWLAAQDDQLKLQTFVNTKLAEGYRVSVLNQLDWEALKDRAEDWAAGTVPMGALFLTAGVDVQRDRLVVVVDGWGPGLERWTVLYLEIYGRTSALEGDESPWIGLLKLLETPLAHESGKEISITQVSIDSGNDTELVYQFCEAQKTNKIRAIKGVDGTGDLVLPVSYPRITQKGRRIRRGVGLWKITVSKGKKQIYSRLNQVTPGAGFHHFPLLPDQFFMELTGEEIRQKITNGFPREVWALKSGRQNHALDCAVYSLAAAYHAGLNMPNYPWARLRNYYAISEQSENAIDVAAPSERPPKVAAKHPRRRSPLNTVTGRPKGQWMR